MQRAHRAGHGHGLAANVREALVQAVLYAVVSLLLLANTINLAADLSAMADRPGAARGGNERHLHRVFRLLSLTLQIFIRFRRLRAAAKWLTARPVRVCRHGAGGALSIESLRDTVIPQLLWRADYIAMLVAVLGTTISPYLFFCRPRRKSRSSAPRPATSR